MHSPAAASESGPDPVAPQASIIILSYNSRACLETLLPSLWRTRGDFEVILADNNSTDGSVELVEQQHPRVRIVRTGGNLGYAAGNNRGAECARSDRLVFLNPDTRVEPDWLAELLAPFNDPTVGLTTAKLTLLSNPQKLNACGNDVHLSGLTMCRGLNQAAERFPAMEEIAAVSGAAFAIRREVFARIGGFNEGFFMYLEETALSLEAQLRGWRCVYTPHSIVQHDYSLRFGPQKIRWLERNRYLMLLQVYRWPTLLVLLPALVIAEIVSWGFVIARDRKNWPNKFEAYADVFKHWSAMRAKRRLNQSQRRVKDRVLLARTTPALDFGQVSNGGLGKVAAIMLNPLFWVTRQAALLLVWW